MNIFSSSWRNISANKHLDWMKCQENRDRGKCQPNQGIRYRDIALINLVNCKRIKKGTYIIDCIQLNTWRLNSVNESNIIKELINEPRATENTKYIYKIKTKELARNEINNKTSEYNLHISPYTPVAWNQTLEINFGWTPNMNSE